MISNENAKELVSDYVKNINEKIQKIRTFRIEKVGLLSADISGNISFLQDSFTNYNPNSFGLSSQSTKKVDKIEKKVEEIIKPISTKTGRKKVWRAAAILLPIIGLSFISITQEDRINEIYSQMSNLNPFYVFTTHKIISPEQEEEIDLPPTIEVIPIETKETEKETEVIIEMKFSVIAGSFSSEKNAKKLVIQLQEENYNAKIIGKNRNGLIRVCYGNFATKEDATLMLSDLKLEGKSVWILAL
jgi:tetrahydromethanopterin S-methyltransferase subunit G